MNISVIEFNDTLMNKHYLGDGAYVGIREDDGMIVIYTTDGIEVTNSVYLDNPVLNNFLEWLKRNSFTA